MKRRLTVIVNIVVIVFIIFFIGLYTAGKREESNKHELVVFQNTAETAGQIIANYLSDEQHLCDIWASYINHYASVSGQPMSIEEAVEFTRRASISDQVDAHIVYYDDGSFAGLSSSRSLKGEDDYTVSYKNYSLFHDFSEKDLDNEVRQTAAFGNPQNGVLSMAFLNTLSLRGENPGERRKALLMRIIPVSEISRKLIYLKGEYEDMDLAIIDWNGKYMIHGGQLKNASFFEYFKSYNQTDYQSQREFEKQMRGETGIVEIIDSHGQKCVVAHTPVTADNDWFLINCIPKAGLIPDVVDWLLLGGTICALVVLLVFNMISMMLFNRRLALTAREAEKANAAKSNFLSMMSHDIRTPMNAITGFNEMIRRESRDPDILRYSEAIRMAGHTLLGLINDILDFSKLEAGKLDLIPAEYDLVSMLNNLVNMIQIRTEEKNLAFRIRIDPDIPRNLYGDELRVKQCVLNLLSNALNYTREGTITFTVGYEPCVDDPDQILLKVRVEDTGCGIRAEDIDKLFVAFKRLEEQKNRNIEGSGLGLCITQSLLSLMDSSLQVESEYGKGSVFSFAIRQGRKGAEKVGEFKDASRVAAEAKGGYEQSFTAPSARVLVVDDTALNLSVFAGLLKGTKIRIDTAAGGAECLRLCAENFYDVIFLDHMMPDMDGITTLHKLRMMEDCRNSETPVICLTSNAISGMREKFLAEGFTDYLTKPIDFDRLELMLRKYIPEEKIVPVRMGGQEKHRLLPEGIRDIQGLDVEAGLKRLGDTGLYLDTLKMYSQVSRENLEEIRNLWSAGDREGLTLKFHALKSTSGVIGALFLAESAAALEAAGRQGEPEKIQRGQIPDDDEPERSRPVQSAYDDEPEKTRPVQTVYDDELEKFLSAYEELTGKLSALFETGEAEPVGELPVGSTPEMSPETIDKASSKHILLVDDDPLYLKMVRSWLSDRYEVTALKSGKQALAYLQGHMVDLILLDFEMKDMDGSVILEHLRQNPSTGEIPVIFLTGRSDEEITSQISGPAPAGYLSKAMDKEQIVDAIDVFLIS